MTKKASAALALLALSSVCGTADARSPASKAEAVIAASKRATGGNAWDLPQGCFEEGTHAGGAVTYRTRFSLIGYGMRIDSERGDTRRAMGFNGKASWRAMADGGVDVRSDPETIREAVLTNYLSVNGYYFPERFPATFKYLREERELGKKFDVVEIAPTGGRPFVAWFDRRTHFVMRVVDHQASPPVTVEAEDYRKAGNFTVAFKLNVLGPDGSLADDGKVKSFRCGPIESSVFDPPVSQ